MTETITRCPKCATSFRITQAHLKSAKGSVRCGSCLSIFNATENLVTPKPSTEPPQPTSTPDNPSPETQAVPTPENHEATDHQAHENTPPAHDTEDDLLISDDMERQNTEEFSMGENFYLPETANVAQSNLFEREAIANKEDTYEDDDSWALNLLDEKDDEEPEPEQPQKTPKPELKSSTKLEDNDTLSDFNSVNSPEPESNITDAKLNHNRSDTQPAKDDNKATASSQPVFDFYDEQEDEPEDNHYDFINAIEPEPVEFSYKQNRSFWLSNGFLASTCLVLLLLLAGQVAWFKFDTLSTIKPYRGFYSYACQMLGCELPKLIDINKIRINQLLVRSHPNEENALIVDAIILNNAPFAQPFPNLTLAFSDINNDLVAHRIFTPNEYIKGELAGRSSMPSLQPISLSFQIVDPGENAVNYLLTLSQ